MDYPGETAFKAEIDEPVLAVTDGTINTALFTAADKRGFENDIENQRNWNDAVISIQEVK